MKADIFSLGQLLFVLVASMFAFEGATRKDKFYSFIRRHQPVNFWNAIPLNGLNLSQSFKNLFIRMVEPNPNQRPTIDQILNDKWMNEINNLNNEQMAALENEVRQEFQNREHYINNNVERPNIDEVDNTR